jgi:hypothetical protein
MPGRPCGADNPRFLRMAVRSAHVGVNSGMIFEGHVGNGGGVCRTGFLSLALRANAGMGGTGGAGEQS